MSLVLNHPLVASLGWAIVHSLWQIALLGVLYAVVRSFLKPQLRYVVGLLTLSLALVAFITTLSIVYVNYDVSSTIEQQNSNLVTVKDDSNLDVEASEAIKAVVGEQIAEDLNLINTTDAVDTSNSLTVENASLEAVADISTERKIIVETSWSDLPSEVLELYQSNIVVKVSMTPMKRWQRLMQPVLPWLVGIWFLGVGVLSIKLIVQFLGIRRLRRLSKEAIPQSLKDKLNLLKQQLSIKRTVELRYSDRVTSPMTMGVFHPVIMLPLTTLTGLSDEQLEAILLHELAHIKRHDYLVNVFQCVVETLLFYHPVLWWISGQVRQNRELCCDDIVLKSQNPLVYAKALTTLESIRQDRLQDRLTVAARGGNLLSRIRRLLGQDDDYTPRWMTGVLTLVFVTILGTVTGFYASVNAQSVLDDIKNSVVIRTVENSETHMVWVTIFGELNPNDLTSFEGQLILEERKNGKRNKVIVTGSGGQLVYQDHHHLDYNIYAPLSESKKQPSWFTKVYKDIYLKQVVSLDFYQWSVSSSGELENTENTYYSYVKLPLPSVATNPSAPINLASLTMEFYRGNEESIRMTQLKSTLVALNHYINHGILNEIVVLDFYKDVMRELASNNTSDVFFGNILRDLPSEAMRVQLLSTQIDAMSFRALYPERSYWESKFNYFDVMSVIYGVESPVYSVVLLEQLMARANEESIYRINEKYPYFWDDIESAIKRLPSEYQESLQVKIDAYKENSTVEAEAQLPSSLWVTVSSKSFEYDSERGYDARLDCRANLTQLKSNSFITYSRNNEAVCDFEDVGDSIKIEYRTEEQVEIVDIEVTEAGLDYRYSKNGSELNIKQGQYLIDRVLGFSSLNSAFVHKFDNEDFVSFQTNVAEEGRYRFGDSLHEVTGKNEAYGLIHEAAHDVSGLILERLFFSIKESYSDPEMMSILLKAVSEVKAENIGETLLLRLFDEDSDIAKQMVIYPFGEYATNFPKTFELFNVNTDEAKLAVLQGFFKDIVHEQYFEEHEPNYTSVSGDYSDLPQIIDDAVKSIESESIKQQVLDEFNAIKAPRLDIAGDTFLGFSKVELEANIAVGVNLKHPLISNQSGEDLLAGRKIVYVEPPEQLRPLLRNEASEEFKTSFQDLENEVSRLQEFEDDIRILVRDDVSKVYGIENELTVAGMTFPTLIYKDYYIDRIATGIAEPDEFNRFTLSVRQNEKHSTFVGEYNWNRPMILCTENGKVIASYITYTQLGSLYNITDVCLNDMLRPEDVALDINDAYATPQFLLEDSKGQQIKPIDLQGETYAIILIDPFDWQMSRTRVETLEAIQKYLGQAKPDIRLLPVFTLPMGFEEEPQDFVNSVKETRQQLVEAIPALEGIETPSLPSFEEETQDLYSQLLEQLRQLVAEVPALEGVEIYQDVFRNTNYHFNNSGQVNLFDENSLLIGAYSPSLGSNIYGGDSNWRQSEPDLWEDIRARY